MDLLGIVNQLSKKRELKKEIKRIFPEASGRELKKTCFHPDIIFNLSKRDDISINQKRRIVFTPLCLFKDALLMGLEEGFNLMDIGFSQVYLEARNTGFSYSSLDRMGIVYSYYNQSENIKVIGYPMEIITMGPLLNSSKYKRYEQEHTADSLISLLKKHEINVVLRGFNLKQFVSNMYR